MEYAILDRRYHLDYQELKEHYHRFCQMDDVEFFNEKNLKEALHLACVICYLKNIGMEATVGDRGVIHLLVHQIHLRFSEERGDVRASFETVLKLD
jgi:hypothetical protein